jgi:hypothetical protein
MAATTTSIMARLALFIVFLSHLQPALASFYTVTSYFVLTETASKLYSTCVEDCRYYTYTDTLTVDPTVTPTADPISSTTRSYTYDDVEVVSVFVAPSAVDAADILPSTTTRVSGVYTDYAVQVVWTAPSSCPTPFTVTTHSPVYLPYDVRPYVTGVSTATSIWTNTRATETITWVTKFVDPTFLPPSSRPTGTPTSNYYYSYYVENCRNPTATGPAYYGPTYTAGSGGSSGGGSWSGGDDDDWDWNVCTAYTGCVGLATYVIVIAVLLPTIFLIGFIESYCWFRRMMLGRSALRLGTICWCVLSLWFILLTRKSKARSPEDQALLKQYWATLSAGTRIKYWFKYGFRWRYPVELLGNPDGNNPIIVAAPPGQFPPGQPGDGSEKPQATTQQQPIYMMQPGQQPYPGQSGQQPYPGQPYMQPAPGQSYMQPMPGQPYMQPYPPQSGFAPPQGYMMPMQGQQPGFAPAPQMGDGQQQQQQQPYIPTPSPAQTGTTDVPSGQPTPPPGHESSQAPIPVYQQQQQQHPHP